MHKFEETIYIKVNEMTVGPTSLILNRIEYLVKSMEEYC